MQNFTDAEEAHWSFPADFIGGRRGSQSRDGNGNNNNNIDSYRIIDLTHGFAQAEVNKQLRAAPTDHKINKRNER